MKIKQFQVLRNEWDFPVERPDDYDVTRHDVIYALTDDGRLLVRKDHRHTNGWQLIPLPTDFQPQLMYAD